MGSGTVGSVLALGMALALAPLGWVVQVMATAVVIAASVWSARPYAVKDGKVLDEGYVNTGSTTSAITYLDGERGSGVRHGHTVRAGSDENAARRAASRPLG